jgi:hypothetical protein
MGRSRQFPLPNRPRPRLRNRARIRPASVTAPGSVGLLSRPSRDRCDTLREASIGDVALRISAGRLRQAALPIGPPPPTRDLAADVAGIAGWCRRRRAAPPIGRRVARSQIGRFPGRFIHPKANIRKRFRSWPRWCPEGLVGEGRRCEPRVSPLRPADAEHPRPKPCQLPILAVSPLPPASRVHRNWTAEARAPAGRTPLRTGCGEWPPA